MRGRARLFQIASSVVAVMVVGAGVAPAARAAFAPNAKALSDPINDVARSSVAVDPAGDTTVVWDAVPSFSPLVQQVMARRIGADGSLGAQLTLSVTGENSVNSAGAVGADGRAFAAWQVPVAPPASGSSIKGRWINPDGTLGPVLTIVAESPTEDAVVPQVVVADNGIATVAWYNEATGQGNAIELRRIHPDGTQDSQTGAALSAAVGGFATAALPGGGTFFAAETAFSDMATNVVSAGGSAGAPANASTSGQVSSTGALAFDSRGDGLVVWRKGNGPPNSIVARRIDSAGNPTGSEITVRATTSNFLGSSPSAGVDSSGHFLVGWAERDTGNDGHGYARAVDPDGSLPDTAHAVSPLSSQPHQPVLALDDRGTGLAVYDFLAPAASDYSADAQVVDASAVPVGGVTTLNGGTGAQGTNVGNDPPSGVATVVWGERANGNQTLMERRYLEPPTCSDSNATVVQGRPIDAPLSCAGVGINSARIAARPRHGKVKLVSSNGPLLRYTPKPGYQGSDSFRYDGINDGGPSNDATVRIAVGRDTVAPKILKLKLRHRKGPRYSFKVKLSEPSKVRVTIEKPAQCKRHGARRSKCFRRLAVLKSKRLRQSVTLRLSRKLVRQLAADGSLVATAVATDAAGNHSKPRHLKVRFTASG